MGLGILKTPFRTPQANAFCERLVGSIRRECLDFLIPLNERHLRAILKEWLITTEVAHTPAWGQVFPNPQEAFPRHKSQATAFRVVNVW
jgi:transposase InsO family protein